MRAVRNRFFQSWFRFRRPVTLGVRAIVENEAGQVLLVRHTYVSGLYFPGGGVEHGETCQAALMKELEEEAGVFLAKNALLLNVYSNHRIFKNDHVLLYHVPNGSWRPITATSRGEISERVWVDPKAPPDDTTLGTKARLLEYYGELDGRDHPGDDYWTPAKT